MMSEDGNPRPDFLLIGAQKCGTSWLWKFLDQHPGTDLPKRKEIHYFGGIEKYRRGQDWYYSHFQRSDPSKVIGEASTTYFYDVIPYWHNKSSQIETDLSLPSIPELVTTELPEVKILLILRDPVKRAISAYKHWMQKQNRWKGGLSPRLGLQEIATNHPKIRLLEYGYYGRYLKLWKEFVPPERLRVFIFEEDVVRHPHETIREIYEFLGLHSDFKPQGLEKPVHRTWSVTRNLLRYYADPLSRRVLSKPVCNFLDRADPLKSLCLRESDIEFLRSVFLPQKEELEEILGRKLMAWRYGA